MRGCGHEWNGLTCVDETPNHRNCSAWDPEAFRFRSHPNPGYEAPKKMATGKAVQAVMENVASRVAVEPTSEGFPAALEASGASAGASWTEAQKTLVRSCIRMVCERHAGGGEFTTDEIWAELGTRVPVSKGMTSMLARAKKDGWLDSTGKTTIAERGGAHDHGQRLTIWYSLIMKRM